jgi:hypothetical protein
LKIKIKIENKATPQPLIVNPILVSIILSSKQISGGQAALFIGVGTVQ